MNAHQASSLVSAVIPTRNRPDLVCRAVRSVLFQTYRNIEAVVVIDGPDEATIDALEAFQDARVRIVALTENVGGSEARNIGAREARGEYIGLLDDDDEWLPEKIEKQMRLANACSDEHVFVASKYITRDGVSDIVLPPVPPDPADDISEYLFCSTTVFGPRLGFLQTSTWLVSRKFMLQVPFTPGLKRNQDTDWILRALKRHQHTLLFVEEPLAIFYAEPTRKRVTTNLDWRDSYQWLAENRDLFTRRSLSFFLVVTCCAHALMQGDLSSALWTSIRDTVRYGQLSFHVVAIAMKYSVISVLPENGVKRRVGRFIRRSHARGRQ